MRYTRTAITQLTKMYRSVLKKCAFLNALILTGVVAASPSWADYVDVSNWSELSTKLSAGNDIKAKADIENANSIATATGDRTFDVNGKTISGQGSGPAGITVNSGSLTLENGGIFTGFTNNTVNNSIVTLTNAGLTIDSGNLTFKDNTADWGALGLTSGAVTSNATLTFDNNTSATHGAGFYYKDQAATAGAIFNGNVTFNDNKILASSTSGSGAGVFVTGGNVSFLGKSNSFTGNQMNANVAESRHYKVGGGAIANQSYWNESTHDPINATMTIGKNAESTVTFTGNTSSTNGGAIMNRAVDTDGNATMTLNGASTFTSNTATENGGAIYNVGMGEEIKVGGDWVLKERAFLTQNGSATFDGNEAGSRGGAIYNAGVMTLNDATFTNNETTTDYAGYYASQGGAIYNTGADDLGSDFTENGKLTINGATFGNATDSTKGNSAIQGGAIANSADETGFGYVGEITLNNTNFYYNKARADQDSTDGYSTSAGGAIWNGDGNITVNGNNTTFKGNTAEGYAAMGGAIRNGYGTMVFNDGATFESNISNKTINAGNGAQGGAINNEGTMTFKDAVTFTGNQATNTVGQAAGLTYLSKGGAVYNEKYGVPATVTFEKGSTFEENQADLGGAIFNNGGTVNLTDATFTNNTANNDGGAIFNYASSTVNINAVNSDVEFSGNTANGNANDIYNIGTLNLAAAADKTISLEGGIDGVSGIVNITGAGTVEASTIKNQTVAVNGGELHLTPTATGGSNIAGSAITVASGAIANTIDGVINDYATGGEGKGTITLADGAIIKGDIDYVNGVADTYAAADGATVTYKMANALGADIQYGATKEIQVVSDGATVNKDVSFAWYTTDHGLTLVGSDAADGKIKVTGTAGGINGAVDNTTDTGTPSVVDYTVTGDETFSGADNVIANSDFTITGQGTDGPAITLATDMIIGDADKHSTLTLNNVKLDGEKTLQNTAGSTLDINNSLVDVLVKNYGTLTSDPTTYKDGIENYLGANATITGDTFSGINRSTENGGAIWNEAGGTLTLNTDTFTGNQAANGGALYNGGAATINGGTFTNNAATANGGAIYSAADLEINATAGEGPVTFTGNTMNNSSEAVANDIYMVGGDADHKVTLALNAADDTNKITLNGGVDGAFYDMNINAATAGDVALGAVAGVDTITVGGGAVSATTVDANSLALNGGTFATTNASTIDTLTTAATTTFTAGNTLGVATALTNAGTLTANGALAVQSGSNSGTINGTGALTLGDGTTTVAFGNTGLISNAISNTAKSTFTTVGVDNTSSPTVGFTGDVANAGTLDVTAGTINSNVSGVGALKTADGVAIATGKTVAQGSLDVTGTLTNAGTLTVAGDITGSSTPTITGAGDINLNGGTAVDATAGNAAVINSTGDVTIGGFVASTAAITAKDIAISAGKYLSIGANNLTDSNDASIANAGTLELTGGTAMDATVTNANAVTGTGQTVISGYVTQTEGKAIDNTAGISVTGGLVANASDLGAAVTNAGTVQLVGGQLDSAITGDGATVIAGDVINNSAITQATGGVTVSSGSLTTNAGAVTGAITNNAASGLVLTGGTNANAIGGTGSTVIDGTVSSTGAISNAVTILAATTADPSTEAKLIIRADKLTVPNNSSIQNAGNLTLTGGALGKQIHGTGHTDIDTDGQVTFGANVLQQVNVVNGKLKTKANNIKVGATNDAILELGAASAGVLSSNIDGTGKTTITGDLTINSGKSISQNGGVEVRSGASTVTNNGSIAGGLTNGIGNTTVTFKNNGNVYDGAINYANFENKGTGAVYGGLVNYGTTTNTGTDSDNSAFIGILNNGTTGKVVNNAYGVISTLNNSNSDDADAITNNVNGIITNLNNSGGVVNAGLLTNVSNSGTIVNNIGTNNGRLTNIVNNGVGGTIITDASGIDSTATVTNSGTIKLTGGELSTAIEGNDGATEIAGAVTVNDATGSIAQDIDITAGSLTAKTDKLTGDNINIKNGAGLTLTGGTNALAANINGYNDGVSTRYGALSVTDDTSLAGSAIVDTLSTTAGKILTTTAATSDITVNDALANAGTITGAGDLTLLGGTALVPVTNEGAITTASVTVGDGTNAAVFKNAGTIGSNTVNTAVNVANGTLTNDANKTITGDVTNSGTVTNAGKIAGNVTNNAGATFTTAGVDDTTTPTSGVTGTIANDGNLEVTGGTIVGAVTGTGTTTISGAVENGASITGNDIAVAAGGKLTTNANTITDKDGVIANAATGTVDLTGGTLDQTIDGGNVEISGDVALGGTPAPTNYFTNNVSTTIDDGATLDINTQTANLGNTKLGDGDPTTGAGGASVGVKITDLANGSSTYTGGQLNVNGNLTTDSDSKLKLDIADGLLEDQHSQSGGLNVVSVTGTGGFTGDQIEVSSDYEVTVNPDGSIVIVNKNSYADVSSAAIGNANNVSAATGWDNATNLPDGSLARDIQKTLNKISKNNPGAYVNALTNLAPTDSALYQSVALEVSNLINEQVTDRLKSQGMNSGDVFERQGAWVKTFYSHAEQDSDRSTPGFTGKTKGIAFGLDGQVDENTTVGVGYSYNTTDADSLNRDIDITGHNIFAYGKYQPSSWFVRGMVNYGLSDYEEKSHVLGLTKTADYDVKNYGFRTYVGYDLPNGFTPEAGLRYTHLTVENYMDSLGQVVRTDDIDILTATLGVNFQKDVETFGYKWTPKAHFGVTYDLANDGADASVVLGNSAYNIKGEALDRFGIEAGVGAEMNMGDWSLSAEYEYGYRDNFENHTGMLQLKYNF